MPEAERAQHAGPGSRPAAGPRGRRRNVSPASRASGRAATRLVRGDRDRCARRRRRPSRRSPDPRRSRAVARPDRPPSPVDSSDRVVEAPAVVDEPRREQHRPDEHRPPPPTRTPPRAGTGARSTSGSSRIRNSSALSAAVSAPTAIAPRGPRRRQSGARMNRYAARPTAAIVSANSPSDKRQTSWATSATDTAAEPAATRPARSPRAPRPRSPTSTTVTPRRARTTTAMDEDRLGRRERARHA